MLVDNVEIKIKAGNGGRGLASFKREKFLPFGGPDGGDGGKGGDIYLKADADLEDLAAFKHKLTFNADNGGIGGKNKMHGLNAQSIIVKVPVGTIAYVKKDGETVQKADLTADGQLVMVARGGRGGRGNVHFATATRKAPHDFQPGEEGEQCIIRLEMMLMADVAIIGLPSSGKSSLLTAISGARPEIAEYQFTTREPVLGVVDDGHKKYVWAEIPAIVAGANKGKGLGAGFIKHIARASLIVYLLDGSSMHLEDELKKLKSEVEQYDSANKGKKFIIAVNKVDAVEDIQAINDFAVKMTGAGTGTLIISAREGTGLQELVASAHKLVADSCVAQAEEPSPGVIFRPRPVDRKG